MFDIESGVRSTFRPMRYPALSAVVETNNGAVSLADKARELILGQIIRDELPAGAQLKSKVLAEKLGMSRTPVATALAKLTADGILRQPTNHRAVVSPGATQWLIQTLEVRQLLEPMAANRAAGNIPDDVCEDWWALSREAKPNRKHDWIEAARYLDMAMHVTIAEFCGNLPIGLSIRKCWKYKLLAHEIADNSRSTLKAEYEEHINIFRAVCNGDSQQAEALMTKHLQSSFMRDTKQFSSVAVKNSVTPGGENTR